MEVFFEGPGTAEKKAGPGDESKLYDIAILGAGPAGLCAGVYSARKKLSCLLVSQDIGGQLGWTSEIENYIGFQYIQGKELIAKFREQVEKYPLDLETGASAISLREAGGKFLIAT